MTPERQGRHPIIRSGAITFAHPAAHYHAGLQIAIRFALRSLTELHLFRKDGDPDMARGLAENCVGIADGTPMGRMGEVPDYSDAVRVEALRCLLRLPHAVETGEVQATVAGLALERAASLSALKKQETELRRLLRYAAIKQATAYYESFGEKPKRGDLASLAETLGCVVQAQPLPPGTDPNTPTQGAWTALELAANRDASFRSELSRLHRAITDPPGAGSG